MKKRIIILAAALLLVANHSYTTLCATAPSAVKPAAPVAAKTQTPVVYTEVNSLDVVNNPSKYLNKNIKIKADFDKFSTLGLDYQPAFKSSENYISFLIRRDDVKDHVIPLSEMKIFIKRAEAEKFIDLESGDVIEFEGKVFSTALSDPWVEVDKLTILTKKNPDKKKK